MDQQRGEMVLIVDDDPLTCRLVEFLLSVQGHTVLTVATLNRGWCTSRHRCPTWCCWTCSCQGRMG